MSASLVSTVKQQLCGQINECRVCVYRKLHIKNKVCFGLITRHVSPCFHAEKTFVPNSIGVCNYGMRTLNCDGHWE